MNCAEFKADVGGCALGALDPHERRAMHVHLDEPIAHDGCRDALEAAERTVAELSSALPEVRPAQRVWRAIERRIQAGHAGVRFSVRESIAWAAALAAAVALGLVQVDRARQIERVQAVDRSLVPTRAELRAARRGLAERERCLKELERMKGGAALHRAAIALLEKSATTVVQLDPVPGSSYRGSVIVNLAERRALVLSSDLPHRPDKELELWVIRGEGAPVPAGFMRRLEDGAALGEIDPGLLAGTAPDAFAVSLEPLGGRPVPTDVVMIGRTRS
jgi:anti-sigma-K factor RskA